jgi:hypothetical protein
MATEPVNACIVIDSMSLFKTFAIQEIWHGNGEFSRFYIIYEKELGENRGTWMSKFDYLKEMKAYYDAQIDDTPSIRLSLDLDGFTPDRYFKDLVEARVKASSFDIFVVFLTDKGGCQFMALNSTQARIEIDKIRLKHSSEFGATN